MSDAGVSPAEIAELGGATPTTGFAPESRITRVSAAGDADARSVVFAEDEATLQVALQSSAGVILAPLLGEATSEAQVMRVQNPRRTFALVAQVLARQVAAGACAVHPGAVVDESARLGARVRVDAGAVIGARAVIGDDVWIGSNVVIAEGVVLGDRVVVQAGAVLGSRGFGYVRDRVTGEYLLFPQQGALIVEDDVEIGANSTIDRGALEETRIGKGTKIDNLVHIGHNCRIGRNVVIAAQVGISGSCVVEDGAVLAGQVGLSDHCHIGPGVILGGQAGVYRGKRMQGAGEVFAGTPAEPLKEQMRGLAQLRRLAKLRRERSGS